jgi:hypothetical protein
MDLTEARARVFELLDNALANGYDPSDQIVEEVAAELIDDDDDLLEFGGDQGEGLAPLVAEWFGARAVEERLP